MDGFLCQQLLRARAGSRIVRQGFPAHAAVTNSQQAPWVSILRVVQAALLADAHGLLDLVSPPQRTAQARPLSCLSVHEEVFLNGLCLGLLYRRAVRFGLDPPSPGPSDSRAASAAGASMDEPQTKRARADDGQ